ncbi:glutaredoxin [PVC group bacterium (ex Bugula neritina AB1)]|nr:glutaredoxin [PVC group bacterium (ex Bugula neritina AB1)]
MSQPVLYTLEECRFCHKVLDYLKEKNISVTVKDINKDQESREHLMAIGGKTQVPCLILDDKPLYESLDIIDWFEKNWDQ